MAMAERDNNHEGKYPKRLVPVRGYEAWLMMENSISYGSDMG